MSNFGVAKQCLAMIAAGFVLHCGASKGQGFEAPSVDAGATPGSDAAPSGPPSPIFGDSGDGWVRVPHSHTCTLPAETDDAPACGEAAPPNSFAPVSKWSWKSTELLGEWVGSLASPLVANMTDDNGDGKVDLCDVPDVVVTIGGKPGKIVMLSGDKGQVEATFEGSVLGWVDPAIGDLDGDGIAEVVATDTGDHVVVYDHQGK